MALRLQLVQSIFIALMFGLIYFQLKLNQKGVQNISGVLFLCMTNSSFSAMFAVVNVSFCPFLNKLIKYSESFFFNIQP